MKLTVNEINLIVDSLNVKYHEYANKALECYDEGNNGKADVYEKWMNEVEALVDKLQNTPLS